MGMLEV